jgi:hypothetical protein
LNLQLSDISECSEAIAALRNDRETTLRLFQTLVGEHAKAATTVLESIRADCAKLRAQHRLSLRQMKDAKRGIRIHGSIVDSQGNRGYDDRREQRLIEADETIDSLKTDMKAQFAALDFEAMRLQRTEMEARLYVLNLLKQYVNTFGLTTYDADRITERYNATQWCKCNFF